MSSRTFEARTNSGVCHFCEQNILRGAEVLYLSCVADAEGNPGRPLSRQQEREYRILVRDRMNARRIGREAPLAPAWLWEQIVHVDCAQTRGYSVPGGRTDARRGTRTVGWNHGARTLAPAALVLAPARPAPAARPAMPGHAPVLALVAVPDVKPAGSETDASVERFRRLDLSGEPEGLAGRLEDAGVDASVERFKLLDLD